MGMGLETSHLYLKKYPCIVAYCYFHVTLHVDLTKRRCHGFEFEHHGP